MKKIANISSNKTSKLSAVLVSLLTLVLLNACTEGTDNVTVDNNGPGTVAQGEPQVTQGEITVDQFVSTVYNGQDAAQKSTGVLYPRCSGCHNNSSGVKQSPFFADKVASDAYRVAFNDSNSQGLKLFDLSTLAAAGNSAVVAKVASGHNCWSGSNDIACQNDATELTNRIQDWYNLINGGTTVGGGGTPAPEVEKTLAETLIAPSGALADAVPTASKTFPDTAAVEFDALHKILTDNCQGCHISNAATPQAPFFADGDRDVAYAALKDNQKIDINVPNTSRLYLRLKDDFHNCWSVCTSDSQMMLTAIVNFANVIPLPGAVPAAWVTSRALTLGEGQVVSGGVRYETDLIAKYEFKEGTGTLTKDSSGILPAIDLSFNDDRYVKWVSGWGVQFLNGGRLISGSATASRKLYDLITPSSQYSIEAWVVPGNVSQGADNPAVLMAYSGGANSRNLTLGQQIYNYTLATRIDSANADGTTGNVNELVRTPNADEVLQATLQHVVATYHPTDGRIIYVNGEVVFTDPTAAGAFTDWFDSFILTMGADSDGANQFVGRMRMLAIYKRAMPADKVIQNFEAGVGQKFNLLFKIGHLDDATGTNRMHDQSYILFTIEEFDQFSYKIFDPRFVVLGVDGPGGSTLMASTTDVAIKGMRIGVNGKEPQVGQVFAKLDTTLKWATFTYTKDENNNDVLVPQLNDILPQVRHNFVTGTSGPTDPLVPRRGSGTIIPKAINADLDQFFLTFEDLGGTNARTDPATPSAFSTNLLTYVAGPAYNFGLRNFDKVYASMVAITGVDPLTTTSSSANGEPIKDVYKEIRGALPSVEDAVTFVPANQVAVSRLTFEFCNAMVDDTTLRGTFFSGFNFAGNLATAYDTAGKTVIVDSLYNNIVGTGIGNQLTKASLEAILFSNTDSLYASLASECATDCTSNTRTIKVAKSMCIAVLGSASMLLH